MIQLNPTQCSHDSPKKYVLMDSQLNMEERLICEICLQKEQRDAKDFIKLEEARNVLNIFNKKIQGTLDPYFNEINNKLQSIEQYVDKQKSQLNILLNSILKDISQWQQGLVNMIQKDNNENQFLINFDNIKRNDEDWLKDCELKITYEIQQLGYSYYHKIDKKLIQYADLLMNFKLADKVIEVTRKNQEKCWNVYIDNSTIKKKQLQQNFKGIYCPEHKGRIAEKINIERNIPKNKRISCQECQQSGLDIEQFIKLWDSIQYEKIDQQQKAQKYMQECYTNSLQKLEQLRNAQYKNLTSMIESVYLKIVDQSNSFQQIYLQSQDFSIGKFQEMADLCCLQQESCELQTISQFLLLLYQKGQAMVQDVKQILINSRYEDGIVDKKNQQFIKVEKQINNNQIQLQKFENLTNTFAIQQILPCYQVDKQQIYSMAFNRNGSFLLTGGDEEIKVFLFLDGKIESIRRMVCERSVSVLQFSQQSNDFISGHIDGSLYIWNYVDRIQYKNKIYEDIHMESIRCLILNKRENELISSADDSTIQVHSLNFSLNYLLLKQSLSKHKQNITSICLNQSETTLLSCCEDGQIIVWKKNQYDDWEFKNFVNHSVKQQGNKIVFISDYQFIWTQFSEKNILIFEEADQTFIQKHEKSIINKSRQTVKFQFIYNSQFKLIICNHGQTIELAIQQLDGKFQIVSSLQNQPNGQQRGVVTNDSKYLVIWNQKLSQFQIFKLYS